jgi:nitrite reductase/ring-hydroxylating ferredoxin subunit
MNTRNAYVELLQDDVGDPARFQTLLESETVPVPEFLASSFPDFGDEALPVERYTSYEFHRLEAERLWTKAWQCVARQEQVPNPGDYVVYDIVDRSVIIVRDTDGRLRGFHNSCLHRGRALRTAGGTMLEIKCPYHGFTWSLEGVCTSKPCAWDFKHLGADHLKLPSVRVDTWGGFVFITFDAAAPPLAEYLGVLPAHFADYLMDRSCTLVHVQKRIACNWKVGQEAFLESLHVRQTHPHILTFIADVDSQYDVFGDHINRMITPSTVPSPHVQGVSEERVLFDSLAASGRMSDSNAQAHQLPPGESARRYIGELNRRAFGAAAGADLSTATLSELQDAILYAVFPNLQIWAGYFGNIVYRFIPDGDHHERCLFDIRLLGRYPEGQPCPPAPPVHRLGDDQPFSSVAELAALGPVFDQDMRNLPHMTKGLKASQTGVVNLAHYQEIRIRHHHRTLDKYLGISRPAKETNA